MAGIFVFGMVKDAIPGSADNFHTEAGKAITELNKLEKAGIPTDQIKVFESAMNTFRNISAGTVEEMTEDERGAILEL